MIIKYDSSRTRLRAESIMAISRMVKILIAGHLSEFPFFIDELQNSSFIHLVDISGEKGLSLSSLPPAVVGERPEEINSLLLKLEESRGFLNEFMPHKSAWERITEPVRAVKRDQYTEVVNTFNPSLLLQRTESLREKRAELEKEYTELEEEKAGLMRWRSVSVPVGYRYESDSAFAVSFLMPEERLASLDRQEIDYLVTREYGDMRAVVAAVHVDDRGILEKILAENEYEDVPFSGEDISPAERFENINSRIEEINDELRSLARTAVGILEDFDKLDIMLEYYGTLQNRSELFDFWISSENAFVIAGWVRMQDIEDVEGIVSSYETIICEQIPGDREENPPVAFDNRPIFRPFQLLTRLYNFPSYRSIDPSPVLAVFFVAFFGLCLTDAGYGIILSALAFYGIRRTRTGRDLLWILFWGGIFTVFAGLATGGIFGDLFRADNPYINSPFMSGLRQKALIFDPMKEPMTFFRLVLLLGVVHVLTGLVLGVASNLKQGRVAAAFIDNGTWLTILVCLLAILFSTDMCVKMALVDMAVPPLDPVLVKPASAVLAVMAGTVFLFGARDEESLFFRFFIGFLKLVVLSGIFSYLGDILSYIRLMALGMVTAGIAMAINAIAFMLYDIPFVGILLAGVVLVVGHAFNMAINLLGGFVHTLRLQYVEFFSKFFTGGGRAFTPLANSMKYVRIIE